MAVSKVVARISAFNKASSDYILTWVTKVPGGRLMVDSTSRVVEHVARCKCDSRVLLKIWLAAALYATHAFKAPVGGRIPSCLPRKYSGYDCYSMLTGAAISDILLLLMPTIPVNFDTRLASCMAVFEMVFLYFTWSSLQLHEVCKTTFALVLFDLWVMRLTLYMRSDSTANTATDATSETASVSAGQTIPQVVPSSKESSHLALPAKDDDELVSKPRAAEANLDHLSKQEALAIKFGKENASLVQETLKQRETMAKSSQTMIAIATRNENLVSELTVAKDRVMRLEHFRWQAEVHAAKVQSNHEKNLVIAENAQKLLEEKLAVAENAQKLFEEKLAVRDRNLSNLSDTTKRNTTKLMDIVRTNNEMIVQTHKTLADTHARNEQLMSQLAISEQTVSQQGSWLDYYSTHGNRQSERIAVLEKMLGARNDSEAFLNSSLEETRRALADCADKKAGLADENVALKVKLDTVARKLRAFLSAPKDDDESVDDESVDYESVDVDFVDGKVSGDGESADGSPSVSSSGPIIEPFAGTAGAVSAELDDDLAGVEDLPALAPASMRGYDALADWEEGYDFINSDSDDCSGYDSGETVVSD